MLDTLMSALLVVGVLALFLIVFIMIVGYLAARDRAERMVNDEAQEKLRQAMRREKRK
jgi:hypothetical protein